MVWEHDPPLASQPCDDPFHVFYLETQATFPQGLPGGKVVPDFRCATCSATLDARFARVDAIQVYSVRHSQLVNIEDSSVTAPNYASNRIDTLGKEFIENPTCLQTKSAKDILCAVCFEKIAPSHESVIHLDNQKQCLAPFHAGCLTQRTKGRSCCPSCSAVVIRESQSEHTAKLLMDERIKKGLAEPRSPAEVDIKKVMNVGYRGRARNHPQFMDVAARKGPSRGRDDTCNICLEKMSSSDLTYTHIENTCVNTYHQGCLQEWVDASKGVKEDNFVVTAKDSKCPNCNGCFVKRPKHQTEIGMGSADVESRFSNLPEAIQNEVLERENAKYAGWPLLIWTDRLTIC